MMTSTSICNKDSLETMLKRSSETYRTGQPTSEFLSAQQNQLPKCYFNDSTAIFRSLMMPSKSFSDLTNRYFVADIMM